MEKQLFISYSHEDKMIVGEIVKRLEDLEIKVFLDEKSIPWGEVIPETVGKALDNCVAILVVVSPDSVKSQWVAFETAFALCKEIPVLPLLTNSKIELPPHLTHHRHLSNLDEAISFFNSDEWDKLSSNQIKKIQTRQEFSDEESLLYVFLFLRVPAPGSGDLVAKLQEIPTVIEAAAVYSDYDVIACLCGKSSQIGYSILKISSISSVKEQKLLMVHKDSELSGECTEFQNPEDIHSYVLIELNANVDAYSIANKIKKKNSGCIYALPIEKENEVIARVAVEDKRSFDEFIMTNIQGTPGVTTTKSYMVITASEMCFSRFGNESC